MLIRKFRPIYLGYFAEVPALLIAILMGLLAGCQPLQPEVTVDEPRSPVLQLHPQNPHYFLYKGAPALLISSAEHYGALINGGFDFRTYLHTLAADSMNYTRIFTGPYIEGSGSFGIANNTLGPSPEAIVVPWARSDQPGYALGGNKFDLEHWNPAYFSRLHQFVGLADSLDIVVEVTLFTSLYESWALSPMHPANHIQGAGPEQAAQVNTLDNAGLLPYQEALVRKLAQELNPYPNILFEIQNEPYMGRRGPMTYRHQYAYNWNRKDPPHVEADSASMAWQAHIARVFEAAEADLPQQHLLAQNVCNFYCSVSALPEEVDVIQFHYANPLANQLNWHWQRPLGFDESGFAGSDPDTYRRQAWNFIFSGGALFNNLDYSFYAGEETGMGEIDAPGGGGDSLRQYLKILRRVAGRLPMMNMHPVPYQEIAAPGAYVQLLAAPGKCYAAYLDGPLQGDFSFPVPIGTYQVSWLSPLTGELFHTDTLVPQEGRGRLAPLEYEKEAVMVARAL